MSKKDERKTMVIGHKNPDTDSICSAIAYAHLKREATKQPYVAMRAGNLNQETQYVLDYFGVEVPEYIKDVGAQVRDMETRDIKGVPNNISLKKAWALMKKENIVTLPIVKKGCLEGVITLGDIANSYMEVYDNAILSIANTQFSNIVETIEGTVLVGDPKVYFSKGKVVVAAANPDIMEQFIDPGDLVILGNRYEAQLCAIEMGASCILVCAGGPVSITIQKIAQEKGCMVISSEFDTFTVARLINQSMPIRHFMRTDDLVTFQLDDFIEDVREVMSSKRYRYFPILDENGRYHGLVSRRNLLGLKKKQVILVDHNEKSQAVDGLDSAEILEIIDHHRLGTIETMTPVYFRNQPLGCTATIIYQMYLEAGVKIPKKIAGLMCCAIISDTLLYRSPTCTPVDKEAGEALAQIAGIHTDKMAKEMFGAGSNLKKKTESEILFQDYKEFSFGELTVGIGQVSSMDGDELNSISGRMDQYLEKARDERKVDMVFLMLTNILEESTILICNGNGCLNLVEQAFPDGIKQGTGRLLPGVVSRKKQMVPALMTANQEK